MNIKKVLSIATVLCITFAPTAFAAYCAVPDANFCKLNRFDNGDFEIVSGNPDAIDDQDIGLATGWSKITNSGDFADLYCPGTVSPNIGGAAPSPQSGVYASMWVSNNYREGMFNKLKTPIPKGNVPYTFTFKTAKMLTGNAVIGVYGVKYDTSTPLPPVISGPTLNLFGAGNMVLLGQINVPANATRTYTPQTITFNSNIFGTMNEITHVLLTRLDGNTANGSYIAFDNFCMQTTQETNSGGDIIIPIDIGSGIFVPDDFPPRSPPASTCCPPLSGPAQMSSLFKMTAHTVPNTATVELDNTTAAYADFVAGYQAYLTLLKFTCKTIDHLETTFTLHTASAIGGTLSATPIGSFKVSFPLGTIAPPLPQFTQALQPNQPYGIQATTVGVDSRGNPVNCGFDKSCNDGDRFTFSNNVGSRQKNPGKTGIKAGR